MIDRDKVKIGSYVLETNQYYFELLWREWYSWSKWYLPPWSLEGKTVLDIGAGCGETALFYYLHGARRVIAVEPQADLTPILKRNMALNNWDMEIIESFFEVSMLDSIFDFLKMDCEGCETKLLNVDAIPPCAIEAHEKTTVDALETKFRMRVLPQKHNWILQNFGEHSEQATVRQ